MANSHETLTGLFTDIADAIRSKSGSSEPIVADNFPGAISAISTQENLDAELATQDSLIAQITTAVEGKAGVALPVLSNPAGAGNIEAGYQAIDGSGNLIDGSMSPCSTLYSYSFNVSGTSATLIHTVESNKNYLCSTWYPDGTIAGIFRVESGTLINDRNIYMIGVVSGGKLGVRFSSSSYNGACKAYVVEYSK